VSRPRQPAPSRIGSAFFTLGCLTVLGVTFLGGMYSGRAWPAVFTWAGPRVHTRIEPGRRPGDGADKRPAGPALTFYEELNAPLTPSPAPPPRPKATKSPKPAGEPAEPESKPAPAHGPVPAASLPPATTTPGVTLAPPAAQASALDAPVKPGLTAPVVAESPAPHASLPETRPNALARTMRGQPDDSIVKFTVQVGAFNARGPADALKAKLAAAGHEAYVAEIDQSGSPRYRVRVGSFATRDEARQVAQRLANERHLPTYVTTR